MYWLKGSNYRLNKFKDGSKDKISFYILLTFGWETCKKAKFLDFFTRIPTDMCTYSGFTATVMVNLCWPASQVKKWRILLEQSFTAHMPCLMAISTL